MNLYLRIKLYLMRKLFGKGPMEVVMGPMMTMISNSDQVAKDQQQKSAAYTLASRYASREAELARKFGNNLGNFLKTPSE